MVAAGDHRRLRAARHPRHLAVARPGRGRRAQGNRAAHPRRRTHASRATAAAACFPRSTATGRRAALDDNKRAVDEALDARRALPRARRRRPAARIATAASCRRTSPARARWCATASASCSSTRAAPACRSRSSRCTRCTPPTAPASTRWRTPTICATSWAPGVGIAVDVYHVWWDPHLEARDRARRRRAGAAARVSHLRLARADHRPADRSRHDGRRRDRPAAPALVDGRRAAIAACTRSRSSPRTTGGSATPTRCSPPASSGIRAPVELLSNDDIIRQEKRPAVCGPFAVEWRVVLARPASTHGSML